MSGMISGLAAGMCIGSAVAAILWDEQWNLRKLIKYQVAAIGIITAIYILR